MSSIVSSVLASPTPSSCANADFTRFPTSDIACAVGSVSGIPSNTSSVFQNCCKSAPVEPFNGPCGYYCLAVQQSVADLQKCFQDGGVNPGSIFCNGNNSATATATPTSSARSTGVTGSATGSPRPSGSGAPGDTGAAAQGVSKAGLGMLCMIFVSAMAGAML